MTDDDISLAWEVELDRLELEIHRVERLITAIKPLEATDWVTPTMTTPLPAHLLERAVDIHERQRQALTQIVRALTRAQRQRRYVDRAATEEQPAPVYVDITA
jgi:hypothetical protein